MTTSLDKSLPSGIELCCMVAGGRFSGSRSQRVSYLPLYAFTLVMMVCTPFSLIGRFGDASNVVITHPIPVQLTPESISNSHLAIHIHGFSLTHTDHGNVIEDGEYHEKKRVSLFFICIKLSSLVSLFFLLFSFLLLMTIKFDQFWIMKLKWLELYLAFLKYNNISHIRCIERHISTAKLQFPFIENHELARSGGPRIESVCTVSTPPWRRSRLTSDNSRGQPRQYRAHYPQLTQTSMSENILEIDSLS